MYGYKTIEGIKVSETKKLENRDEFYQSISSALKLIKQNDTRRFKRVVDHINHIYNDYSCFPGCFLFIGKRCRLDSCFFPEKGIYRDHYIAWILIHEATHGLFFQRGINYTKKTKFRIEHACFKEQKRFIDGLEICFNDEWKDFFSFNPSIEQIKKNYSKKIIDRCREIRPVLRRIINDSN